MKLYKYLTFALFPILAACGRESTFEWKEEVQLQDGRVIVVTQKRRYERVYDGNSTGDITRESWLTFSLPESENKVVVWNEKLKPRILNIDQGKIYVVGWPPTSREFDLYGKVKPGWICFVLSDGKWERISLNQVPKTIWGTNLLLGGKPKNDLTFISLIQKKSKEMNGDHRYDSDTKYINPSYQSNW